MSLGLGQALLLVAGEQSRRAEAASLLEAGGESTDVVETLAESAADHR